MSGLDPRRAAVIAETESWLGTPFHHAARVKGAGVDCGQLPLAVYEAVGLFPHVDTEHYSPDYAVHQGREWYAELCAALGREITGPPEPGDFALFRLYGQRVFGHGVIVTAWPLVIHAYFSAGVVCRGDATLNPLAGRPVRFFSPFH